MNRFRFVPVVVMVSALVAAIAPPAFAAAGALDTSFGGDGKVTTSFGSTLDYGQGVGIQADGKIVVAGTAGANGSNPKFAVARYNTDGTLDTSFSGDGKVKTDVAVGNYDGANAVALQADGKIVAAGGTYAGTSNEKFAVVRYDSDGSLDTSFSGDGINTANFTSGADTAVGVAIQADGKVVLAGISNAGGNADFALARYNADGTLDTSFDGDGKVTTSFTSDWDAGLGLAIQGNGMIVVVGEAGYLGSNPKVAVARYTSAGALDTSFSGDGKFKADLTPQEDWAYGVAIQGDGKIVVSGEAGNGGVGDFGVLRFTSTGTLDTSFGGDGKVTTSITSNWDGGTDLALQGDGKIVVVGESGFGGSNPKFAAVRYDADGSLDTSFSGDGKTQNDIASGEDGANGVAIQADGNIVSVGFSGGGDFALVRYLAA
jgi:uncharacterized delta-60 repeat protein